MMHVAVVVVVVFFFSQLLMSPIKSRERTINFISGKYRCLDRLFDSLYVSTLYATRKQLSSYSLTFSYHV